MSLSVPNASHSLDRSAEPIDAFWPMNAGPRTQDEAPFILLARKLWRRRGVIIMTTLIVSALVVLVDFAIPPTYTATALIMIEPQKPQIANIQPVLSPLSSDSEAVQGEVEVLKSRLLAERTINQLKLNQDPELSRPAQVLARVPGWERLRDFASTILSPLFGHATHVVARERQAPDDDGVVAGFLGHLQVTPVSRSRVIRVSYDSQDPEKAARIVNTLTQAYIEAQIETKAEATRRLNRWLRERLVDLQLQVQTADEAVEGFRRQSGLVSTKDSSVIIQQLSQLRTQLIEARAKHAAAEANVRNIRQILSETTGKGWEVLPEILQSPVIQRLKEQEATASAKVVELSERFGNHYPGVISGQAELADIRTKLSLEANKIIKSSQIQAATEGFREKELSAELDKVRAEYDRANGAAIKLGALEREADASRSLLQTFLARFKETSQEPEQQPEARVISPASVPSRPTSPNVKFLLMVGLIGAGGSGVSLALLMEHLDRSFRSMDQIEAVAGVPALGILPKLRRGRAEDRPEILAAKPAISPYGEALRRIQTRLVPQSRGTRRRTILVCSSVESEGKTTAVLSLARFMSTLNYNVVAIDCDLRRPQLHQKAGISRGPGLSNYLTGAASLSSIISIDPTSGTAIIPSGEANLSALAMLASARMSELLQILSGRYDIVLIDSPPLMAVSDAAVLAQQVNNIVFLVRWGSTSRQVVLHALGQLADVGGHVSGIVLTMVNARKHVRYQTPDAAYHSLSRRKYSV